MNEIELYKLIKHHKGKFTRQQFLTIKGQINKKEYLAAYKGIMKCIERRRLQNEIRNNR